MKLLEALLTLTISVLAIGIDVFLIYALYKSIKTNDAILEFLEMHIQDKKEEKYDEIMKQLNEIEEDLKKHSEN